MPPSSLRSYLTFAPTGIEQENTDTHQPQICAGIAERFAIARNALPGKDLDERMLRFLNSKSDI